MHVEVSIGLECVGAHVKCRNGRVMRDLLHINWNASHYALKCFAENGIKGLSQFGMASEDENEGTGYIFHLLYHIVCLNGLVHIFRNESEASRNSFD